MSRLEGISDRDAGLGAKIAFFFTKRRFKQMTGRETPTMLEPLRMYAYIPRLLTAYGRLEQAEAKLDILNERQRTLAELKSATTAGCEFCIDLGSQIARASGILTDEELLALPDYRNSALFLRCRQADPGVLSGDHPHAGRGQRRAFRAPAGALRHRSTRRAHPHHHAGQSSRAV